MKKKLQKGKGAEHKRIVLAKNHKSLSKSAARKKHFRRQKRYNNRAHPDPLALLRKIRTKKQKEHFKPRKYNEPPKTVTISKSFGVEHNFDYFLDIAEQIVASKSKRLILDLAQCPRVWPSAITLMCSLKRWVDMTAYHHHAPLLGSTSPSSNLVSSYLDHSGFYDYVHRPHDAVVNTFEKAHTSRIRNESDNFTTYEIEDEIVEILSKYSTLTSEQIEEIDSIVLVEILNNVTEHGVGKNGKKGWWSITQYHPTTQIISVCIADNGIGFKNSLSTGPQRETVISKYPLSKDNEDDYIEYALKENVSGALRASVKNDGYPMFRKFKAGSRRGNGLNRITEVCNKNNIPFWLISNKGYLAVDGDGKILNKGTKPNPVFAGTMFHLEFPAKGIEKYSGV